MNFSGKTRTLAVVLLSCAACTPTLRHSTLVTSGLTGWIGAHQLTLPAQAVPTSATFPIERAQAAFIAITELYPDTTTPAPFHYLVSGTGIATYERHYFARGFGPVTYFLRVAKQPVRAVTLTNLGGADHAPRILGVRAVTQDEIATARQTDRFRLMGTVFNPRQGMSEDQQVMQLAQQLPADPQRRLDKAFACEIYYANRDAPNVRHQLEAARQRSRQYSMPVLLGLVSWWGGTPRNVPDGLGGKFDDLAYQQICYTPERVHPENEKLHELLGDRYNPHYCLSTPNIWSDTPWLTINSPVLNAYRAQRLREAIEGLKEICQGDTAWIAGIFLENEPRYWDTEAARGTPHWQGEQWADFNPCVVAAAAHEGVTLNPADGLTLAELNWLQKNAGRYFQETVNMTRQALAEQGLLDRFPLYTHSLQLAALFPGNKINRTAADWARAAGARTGLEGMWSQPSDFDRVREWGPWCNLNREEGDGLPIETHLWDLRTSFAMGAEFYNSYNWYRLKADAYFNYVRRFLAELPSVTNAAVHAKQSAPDTISFTPPGDLQAFTRIIVPVQSTPGHRAKGSTVALAIDGGPPRTWFSERQPLPTDGRHLLTFVSPAPAEVKWSATGTIQLHTYDANGAETHGAAIFTDDTASALRLIYDLQQSRTLSQLVIQWQQAAAY